MFAKTSRTASRSSSWKRRSGGRGGETRQETDQIRFYQISRAVSWLGLEGFETRRRATEGRAAHLVEHAVELVPSLRDAIAIVAIHHEDQTLRVLEVVPPERADLGAREDARGERSSARRQTDDRGRGGAARETRREIAREAARTLSWPPTSHTVNEMFLYSTVSTLKPGEGGARTERGSGRQDAVVSRGGHRAQRANASRPRPEAVRKTASDPSAREETARSEDVPIVGMVVTISPSLSLYRMVVLPAASRPTCGGSGEGAEIISLRRGEGRHRASSRVRPRRGSRAAIDVATSRARLNRGI